jgi:hypothetical protein
MFNDSYIENDECSELIKICDGKSSAKYMKPELFNELYNKYFTERIRSGKIETESDNNWQVIKAMNIIYIDFDAHFRKDIQESEFDSKLTDLACKVREEWENELHKHYLTQYTLFIPSLYTKDEEGFKAGFHLFIYLDSNISKDDREQLYHNVKINFEDCFYADFDMFLEFEYDKMFDKGPLTTCTCLLPFAQKIDAKRSYKLIDNTNEFKLSVIPSIHTDSITIAQPKIIINSDLPSEILNIIDTNTECRFTPIVQHIFKFIKSLLYLSDNHGLWMKLSLHDNKRKEILTPVIAFIQLSLFLDNRIPHNYINDLIASLINIFLPLMQHVSLISVNKDKSEMELRKSLYKEIKGITEKYTGINGKFNNDMLLLYNDFRVNSTPAKRAKFMHEFKDDINKLLGMANKVFDRFSTFALSIVMDGLTDELKPFDERGRTNPFQNITLSYDDVKGNTILKDATKINIPTFYEETLSCWIRMFIACSIMKGINTRDIIGNVLSSFIRSYVAVIEYTGKGNVKCIMYNEHQTSEFCHYSYNQFILDESLHLLSDFVLNLTSTIEKEFENVGFRQIKTLLSGYFSINPSEEKLYTKQKIIAHDKAKENDTLVRRIISTVNNERQYSIPNIIDMSATVGKHLIPLRNGILHILPNGEVRFLNKNHDTYIPATTNIIYREDYNYHSARFRFVKDLFDSFFVERDAKIYFAMVCASDFVTCFRDMIHIIHGSGSDGKSTFVNLHSCTLGGNGAFDNKNINDIDGIHQIKFNKGLAGILNPIVFMENPKNKSSAQHDSGGIGNVIDCRFVSIQEPDSKANNGVIDSSRIKELTSGSPFSYRLIFDSARTKTLNTRFMFQTNTLLQFSEYGTAMTRRTSIYQFKKKFIAKNIADKFINVENTSEAKTDLNGKIFDDPEIATDYFMMLLPYIREFVRRGITSLSDIPIPKCIENDTTVGFNQINDVFKYCNEHILKCEGRIINIKTLADKIFYQFQGGYDRTSKCLEILKSIDGYFQGAIYKLQSQFYSRADTQINIKSYDLEKTVYETNDEIIAKYFNSKALSDISSSRVKDKEDLYIVGYDFMDKIDKTTLITNRDRNISDLYENDPLEIFLSKL